MPVLVFLLGAVIGYGFGRLWVYVTDNLKPKPIALGYHFHHSLFFIPACLLALFLSGNIATVLWGIAVGVVFEHTIKEGLIFITKE